MNCKQIVYGRFIKPLCGKTTGAVGTELEFPMLNMQKQPVEKHVAVSLLQFFLDRGFHTEESAADGTPAFILNSDGDCISFDNSYNNLEFSMQYGENLLELSRRFYRLFHAAQGFLKPHHYLLTGMGTNPYKQYIAQSHVDYPVYNMVDRYLHRFSGPATHSYPDFPAYLSSVQTHLDITPEDLPKTATLFAKTDFLRGLLFSNSPDFSFSGVLCYRDELWHKSAFGLCGHNTGPVDETYETLDDIAASFYSRCMFNRIRNGAYEVFAPVPLTDYFGDGANPAEDIRQFLSFRHIEITARGTLEVRSDCTQPVSDAFVPPAFNLGLAHRVGEALRLTDALLEEMAKNGLPPKRSSAGSRRSSDIQPSFQEPPYAVPSNAALRRRVSNGLELPGISAERLKNYAKNMVELAAEGLKSRGFGEEQLLKPLFLRAEKMECPAKQTYKRLSRGEPIESVIIDYAK